MLSRFLLNNSNTKMLAPHAVDITVTISSLIASLCFTFAEPFDIFLFVKWSCALVSGNTNKSLRPKDRPIDKWIRAHSLNSYFAFCKIVVKTIIEQSSCIFSLGCFLKYCNGSYIHTYIHTFISHPHGAFQWNINRKKTLIDK